MTASAAAALYAPVVPRLSFTAAETSWCSELEVTAEFAAQTGVGVVVSSAKSPAEAKRIVSTYRAPATVDTMAWRHSWASVEQPTALHASDSMFGTDYAGFASEMLARTGARTVYVPGHTVAAGRRDILEAAVTAALEGAQHGMQPFVALDATALEHEHFPDLVAVLERFAGHALTFQFGAKAEHGLAKWARMENLRFLLTLMPGTSLAGVDVCTAVDALAHGAAAVSVGASSTRRFPRVPGVSGGGSGNSAGYKPGTWLRSHMAMHSPDVYADWFVLGDSPRCQPCGRDLDVFEATAPDKSAAIAHNIHAIADHVADLLAQPAAEQGRWIDSERRRAFEALATLMSPARQVQGDRMLRVLVELDDPDQRSTTPDGHWVQL